MFGLSEKVYSSARGCSDMDPLQDLEVMMVNIFVKSRYSLINVYNKQCATLFYLYLSEFNAIAR